VRLPVLVGGTGQYVDSVLSDIEFLEQPTDLVYRKFLFDVAVKNGAEFLHKKLAEVDAESAAKIHPNNVKRVARALEIFHATGMTVFEINAISRSRSKPYDALIFGLNIDRNILYARINARVDKMIMDGLASEVIALKNAGIPRDGTAMQAIGYKEIFDYFDIYNNQAQNFQNSAEFAIVIEKIKQRSRNYAKRQLTWFRRNPNIIWFDCALGFEKNLGKVFAKIREFGIM
jgi:tRNA dimethylallyltransferase